MEANAGGMLKAIEMINSAKFQKDSASKSPITVDLHPTRPFYRGFDFGGQPVSMTADPTFAEIEKAGGVIARNSEPHTVLDDMFLVSGYIPGVAPYETGLKNGIQFFEESGKWEKDEEMADERFLMCNLKGTRHSSIATIHLTHELNLS
jgi:7,8-dihydropterin-6-yl-methyl-4-(beta-D-ribofuranosyl)aminobenzene 5'-phosphate synthase